MIQANFGARSTSFETVEKGDSLDDVIASDREAISINSADFFVTSLPVKTTKLTFSTVSLKGATYGLVHEMDAGTLTENDRAWFINK
jgi:hypothetical protein